MNKTITQEQAEVLYMLVHKVFWGSIDSEPLSKDDRDFFEEIRSLSGKIVSEIGYINCSNAWEWVKRKPQESQMTSFDNLFAKYIDIEDVKEKAKAFFNRGPSTEMVLAFALLKAFERIEALEYQLKTRAASEDK